MNKTPGVAQLFVCLNVIVNVRKKVKRQAQKKNKNGYEENKHRK